MKKSASAVVNRLTYFSIGLAGVVYFSLPHIGSNHTASRELAIDSIPRKLPQGPKKKMYFSLPLDPVNKNSQHLLDTYVDQFNL